VARLAPAAAVAPSSAPSSAPSAAPTASERLLAAARSGASGEDAAEKIYATLRECREQKGVKQSRGVRHLFFVVFFSSMFSRFVS